MGQRGGDAQAGGLGDRFEPGLGDGGDFIASFRRGRLPGGNLPLHQLKMKAARGIVLGVDLLNRTFLEKKVMGLLGRVPEPPGSPAEQCDCFLKRVERTPAFLAPNHRKILNHNERGGATRQPGYFSRRPREDDFRHKKEGGKDQGEITEIRHNLPSKHRVGHGRCQGRWGRPGKQGGYPGCPGLLVQRSKEVGHRCCSMPK